VDRIAFGVIGMAFLVLAGCGHEPETAAVATTTAPAAPEAPSAAPPPAPSTGNQPAALELTAQFLQQAETDSGYCRCLLVKSQESLEQAPPDLPNNDQLLEATARQAEEACQAESGKFAASLRANGADVDMRGVIHAELLQAMRYSLGLSDQPSALFLSRRQSQAL
jgi:hypothetical protein